MPDAIEPLLAPGHRLRRQILKGTLGTLAVALAAYFSWTKYLFPATTVSPAEASGSGLSLGKVSDFAPNKPPVFIKPAGTDVTYIVENTDDMHFRVLNAKCTHQGCIVGWDEKNGQFLCPCHAARFDRTGQVVNGPAKRPLGTVKTDVQHDELFLVS